MTVGLKIGKLSQRCGVSADTVRFYEREGLLPRARRSPSDYRMYDQQDEGRLRFIRRAQALGLTLEDIRELLSLGHARTPGECGRVAERLRARIAAVDERSATTPIAWSAARSSRSRTRTSALRCTARRCTSAAKAEPRKGRGLAASTCPECGERGRTVDQITLKALLRPDALMRFLPAAYRFCPTAAC
jgi:MerR family copper efflux transcriptional regulator